MTPPFERGESRIRVVSDRPWPLGWVPRWLWRKVRPSAGALRLLHRVFPGLRWSFRERCYRTARACLCLAAVVAIYVVLCLIARFPWGAVYGAIALIALAYRNRGRVLHQFGTAAFASETELEAAGCFKPGGMGVGQVLGRRPNPVGPLLDKDAEAGVRGLLEGRPPVRTVYANTSPHLVILGPTGSGKDVSFVQPFLATNPYTTLALDPKDGEAVRTLKGARARFGPEHLLDPFGVAGKTATLNPLDWLDPKCQTFIEDCLALAAPWFTPEPGHGDQGNAKHFLSMARLTFAAAIAWTCIAGRRAERSLNQAAAMLRDRGAFAELGAAMQGCDLQGGLVAQLGHSLSNLDGRERDAVITTFVHRTEPLLMPAVAAFLADSTVNPAVVNGLPCTVWLANPAHRAAQLAPLTKLLLGLFTRARFRHGLGHPVPLTVLANESRLLSGMEEVPTILTLGRGYNILLYLFYQNLGSLKESFPADGGDVVLSNCGKVFFGTNTPDTADYVARFTGSRTAVLRSGGTSTGGSHQTSGQGQSSSRTYNDSSNWQLHEEKLLRSEQVLNDLSPRTAVVLLPGVRPLLTHLTRFYEQKAHQPPPRPVTHLAWSLLLLGLALFLADLVTPRSASRVEVGHQADSRAGVGRPRPGGPAGRQ